MRKEDGMRSDGGRDVRSGRAGHVGRAAKARVVLRAMWSAGVGRYALVTLGVWGSVALLSCVWTPWPLSATDGYHAWDAPSLAHPLGTDGTGADILSWLMAGSRTNLAIALLTVAGTLAVGLLLVGCMSVRSAWLSSAVCAAVDALIALPTVLVALLLAVPFGASAAVVVGACSLAYGLNLARVAKPAALLAARSDYVAAARANGASGPYLFVRHVLPGVTPVLAVQASIAAGTSVLAEAGLTYLGVGVGAGVPSWGHSLATSARLITVFPLTVLWPGLVVTAAVSALNLFGDVLREAADPMANGRLRTLGYADEIARAAADDGKDMGKAMGKEDAR